MQASTRAILGCVLLAAASIGSAKGVDHSQADAQALDLAKQAIALRSVRGPGNQAPQVAALFKSALVAGGYADADVTITPVDDTAFLIARWKGRIQAEAARDLRAYGRGRGQASRLGARSLHAGGREWAPLRSRRQRHEVGRRTGGRNAHRAQAPGIQARVATSCSSSRATKRRR